MTKMKLNEHIEHQHELEVDHPEELNEVKMYQIIHDHHMFSEEDKDIIHLNDIYRSKQSNFSIYTKKKYRKEIKDIFHLLLTY
jgi:hypothetical protein